MLKLTRRPFADEVIYIQDESGKTIIKLQVCGVRGNQVSLGFTAPRSVQVMRGEIMSQEAVENAERDLGHTPQRELPEGAGNR